MSEEEVKDTVNQVSYSANSMIYVQLIVQILIKSKMTVLLDFYFLFQYIVFLDKYQVNYPALVDITLLELRFLVEFQMLKA